MSNWTNNYRWYESKERLYTICAKVGDGFLEYGFISGFPPSWFYMILTVLLLYRMRPSRIERGNRNNIHIHYSTLCTGPLHSSVFSSRRAGKERKWTFFLHYYRLPSYVQRFMKCPLIIASGAFLPPILPPILPPTLPFTIFIDSVSSLSLLSSNNLPHESALAFLDHSS